MNTLYVPHFIFHIPHHENPVNAKGGGQYVVSVFEGYSLAQVASMSENERARRRSGLQLVTFHRPDGAASGWHDFMEETVSLPLSGYADCHEAHCATRNAVQSGGLPKWTHLRKITYSMEAPLTKEVFEKRHPQWKESSRAEFERQERVRAAYATQDAALLPQ
jgi:hypothetical protein